MQALLARPNSDGKHRTAEEPIASLKTAFFSLVCKVKL